MTYEMLAGTLPFQGTIFELIHAHCNEPPPPLKDLVPGLEPELDETVARMLAKSPPERWPSLGDVAKRLMTGRPHRRQTSEVRATIVALASSDSTDLTSQRTAVFSDLSSAATELATTPAPGLVITPHDPTIEVGQVLQMKLSQQSGASLAGVRIVWRSEDPTIATIDENGLVTGRSQGFAKITASGGASIGRIAITVKAASVDTLVVTPQNRELVTGAEIQFVATVLDSRGTTLTGQPITWQSSDVGVCAVSGEGRAIGITAGKATITASCGDVHGTAQVRVRLPAVERVVIEPGEFSIEADETRRVTATVFGAEDRKLTGRALTWRSTVPAVATVDGEGTVKGIAPGTAAIVATCDGKDGLVSVTVRSQPIVTVRIEPAHLQLETGRSLQLRGTPQDRRGRDVNEKGLEWQSDDDRIALVDASGKVHAVREGRTHVRALVGDVAASIEVAVVPRPAAQIRIEPHRPSIAAGEFITLDATVLDADGATLAERDVTWTSSDPKVVEVNASGACEAKKPGAVRITAACERARATTKLSVAGAPLAAAVPAPAGDKRAAATEVIAAVAAPRRNAGRLAGIAGGIVVVAAAGIWLATRGGGTASQPVGTSAPVTATKSVDTSTAAKRPDEGVAQRPTEVVTQQPQSTTKAPASSAAGRQPGAEPPAGAKAGAGATAAKTGTPDRGATKTPVTQPVKTQDNPPVTQQNPPARGAQPPGRADSTAGKAPPVITPPPGGAVVPPPAAVTPPPARGGTADPEATRALLCGSPALPANLLNDALAADPVARLGTLYVPRDAADAKAKESMLSALKDARGPHAAARTVRNEAAGEGCDWVMVLEFNWAGSFGRTTKKSWQVRMLLEAPSGAPRIKHIFGATSQ